MKKLTAEILKTAVCFSFMLVICLIWHSNTIFAENNNTVLDELKIVGPDYIYECEETAAFTLEKKKSTEEPAEKEISAIPLDVDAEYWGLKYQWESDNEKVAKFSKTLYQVPTNSCVKEIYPVLSRPNIFEVKRGKTTIRCIISDHEGNSVTLTKKLVVLKGTPLQQLKIGTHELTRSQRCSTSSYIFTNEKKKKVKIQISVKDNWEIKKIQTYCYTKKRGYDYKTITKNREIPFHTDDDVPVYIMLKNKKNGQVFHYTCELQRYTEQELDLGKLKNGCAIITQRTAYDVNLLPRYICTIRYKKNARANDEETFKSAKDLVRKLKKYYDYTDQTIAYKNGKIVYKEVWGLPKWYYCRSKKEQESIRKKFENHEIS